MGEAYEVNGTALKMADGVKAQIPFQLDAGYRVTPEITIGAYGSYGIGQIGGDLADGCDNDRGQHRLLRDGVAGGRAGTYAFHEGLADVRALGRRRDRLARQSYTLDAPSVGLKPVESLGGWEFPNLAGRRRLEAHPAARGRPARHVQPRPVLVGTVSVTGGSPRSTSSTPPTRRCTGG
ncbi:MAG: hypothetical protein MZU95_05310 [Desulfomicrobium escambiense]|nr:hypothetical protein [Desulfomicrobium escambiense]